MVQGRNDDRLRGDLLQRQARHDRRWARRDDRTSEQHRQVRRVGGLPPDGAAMRQRRTESSDEHAEQTSWNGARICRPCLCRTGDFGSSQTFGAACHVRFAPYLDFSNGDEPRRHANRRQRRPMDSGPNTDPGSLARLNASKRQPRESIPRRPCRAAGLRARYWTARLRSAVVLALLVAALLRLRQRRLLLARLLDLWLVPWGLLNLWLVGSRCWFILSPVHRPQAARRANSKPRSCS